MKITVARDVEHKAVPCTYVYAPHHVRAKETYKKDLQKRPTKRPSKETYKKDLQKRPRK